MTGIFPSLDSVGRGESKAGMAIEVGGPGGHQETMGRLRKVSLCIVLRYIVFFGGKINSPYKQSIALELPPMLLFFEGPLKLQRSHVKGKSSYQRSGPFCEICDTGTNRLDLGT